MSMDLADLFIESVGELRQRCDVRTTEYDIIHAARLIRFLLMDGDSITAQIGKIDSTPVVFSWFSVSLLDIPSGVMGATVLIDPKVSAGKVLIEKQGKPDNDNLKAVIYAGVHQFPSHDGFEPDQPISADWQTFKDVPMIWERAAEGRRVTVRQIVAFYANKEGAVHLDRSRPGPSLITELENRSEHVLQEALAGIARVVVGALEPVAASLWLSSRIRRSREQARVEVPRRDDPDTTPDPPARSETSL